MVVGIVMVIDVAGSRTIHRVVAAVAEIPPGQPPLSTQYRHFPLTLIHKALIVLPNQAPTVVARMTMDAKRTPRPKKFDRPRPAPNSPLKPKRAKATQSRANAAAPTNMQAICNLLMLFRILKSHRAVRRLLYHAPRSSAARDVSELFQIHTGFSPLHHGS